MTQYHITQTPEGILEVSEGKVLSYEPMMDDDGNENPSYSWGKDGITKQQYDEMYSEITGNTHQVLTVEMDCIGMLEKSTYYCATRKLTDEILSY